MARQSIEIIAPGFDRHDALKRMTALGPEQAVSMDGAVYYPYFRFAANCKVPGLFARPQVNAQCLVDGRRGIGATAEPFATVEESVGHDEVLGALLSADAAAHAAQRFMTHAISRRTRTIASFSMDVSLHGLVFKRFWLARAGGQRFVVDSVTGQLHGIGRAAA